MVEMLEMFQRYRKVCTKLGRKKEEIVWGVYVREDEPLTRVNAHAHLVIF